MGGFGERHKRTDIKSEWDEGTHLEELQSFSLQSLGGKRGEGRAQTLLTETQGLTPPQGQFWGTHVHADKHTD